MGFVSQGEDLESAGLLLGDLICHNTIEQEATPWPSAMLRPSP